MSLPFPAQREDTPARGDFGRWIIEHIEACFAFANHLGLGIKGMEDIILITGYHCTESWIAATLYESQMGSRVSFRVQGSSTHSGDSHVDLKWIDAHGGTLKLGPLGKVRFCIITPSSGH